jgi:hypothetical protein
MEIGAALFARACVALPARQGDQMFLPKNRPMTVKN